MSKQENIIEIHHLNKSFGKVKAVNDLSFRVKRGELFAFLGVNGAGKSTTISMICGQLTADGGDIWVNGWNVNTSGHQIKEMTGVVFQDSVLDKPLTARENLKSRAALYGITGKKFEERFDPEKEYRIDVEKFASKGKNTPFNGYSVKGEVACTIVDGKIVYQR